MSADKVVLHGIKEEHFIKIADIKIYECAGGYNPTKGRGQCWRK